MWRKRVGFFKVSFVSHILPRPRDSGGGKVITFTIFTPRILLMLQIKSSSKWPCWFKELKLKIVNRRLTTHRRRLIAIGHMSDSGDQKRRGTKFVIVIASMYFWYYYKRNMKNKNCRRFPLYVYMMCLPLFPLLDSLNRQYYKLLLAISWSKNLLLFLVLGLSKKNLNNSK